MLQIKHFVLHMQDINECTQDICVSYNFFIHGTHISHSDMAQYTMQVQWFSNVLPLTFKMVTHNQAPHSFLLNQR